ncbi:MAG: AAA family ATPase [Lentisphaeria bacterium]|nr:AAA family ATPase [Lentisphaeria bacterium]
MIRSHFGLELNPFDEQNPALLAHQQEIFETIKVHAHQGGLCVIMGEPGTGKTVIKQAIINHDPKRMITPAIARTLHTYSNTLLILCECFGIDVKGRDTLREKLLIEAGWKINADGKMLVPIIDDAHLMDVECLRKLRLLFEDFPKNHNLVLIAQAGLMHKLRLTVNEDIRSRITYSVKVPRLGPEDITAFIYTQLDHIKLGHNAFSDAAIEVIVRASEGILRRTRNLCISAMLETVRDRKQVVDTQQVNRVLMQPHWRKDHDLETL